MKMGKLSRQEADAVNAPLDEKALIKTGELTP